MRMPKKLPYLSLLLLEEISVWKLPKAPTRAEARLLLRSPPPSEPRLREAKNFSAARELVPSYFSID